MYEEKVSSSIQTKTRRLESLYEGIRKATEEVCGLTSGKGHRERERHGSGMRMYKEQLMKSAFKLWQRIENEEGRELYKGKRSKETRQVAWVKKWLEIERIGEWHKYSVVQLRI